VKTFEGGVTEAPEGWNATFDVIDADGDVIARVEYKDFDGGSYTVYGLQTGDYTVVERDSDDIDGYVLDVTIDNDGNVTIAANENTEVTVKNTYSEIADITPTPTPSASPSPSPAPTGGRQNTTPVNVTSSGPEVVLEIAAEEVYIDEEDEEYMDLDENGVALGLYDNEEEEEARVEEDMDILDEAPPTTSMMPQTGIEDTLTIWIFALSASLLGVAALFFAVKKIRMMED